MSVNYLMYHFPTDPKKIKQRIRRYERSLRKDPIHGLRDGYGKRYLLGPLYLMLGNVQDTLDHYKWYQNIYPDDSGYALNFLCWAIALFRHGDIEEAEKKLIKTILSNIFLVPFILGHKIPSLDSWEDRYYNELMEIEYFPHEILEFTTSEEMEWKKHCITARKSLLFARNISKLMTNWKTFLGVRKGRSYATSFLK